MKRILGVGAALVLAGLGLAACGGDDGPGDGRGPAVTSDSEASDGGGDLTVVAEDIAFTREAYEASAGQVSFDYENEGSLQHTLLIDGVDDFGLEVSGNGDVDQGSVDLEAGTYTIYCGVAGHRRAGMEAELEVS